MKTRLLSAFAFILLATLGLTRPASAQFAVIDVASLAQLMVQVQQIAQEIEVAQSTLSQVRQTYDSTTGIRGMQNLLSNMNRNYLPTNWSQLTGAMGGAGGAYSALGSDVTSTVQRNAVLTSAQTAQLSGNERDSLTQRRQSLALWEALARSALSNSSNRFSSLQSLINAIPAAKDQKGALELNARVGAEQTMTQNEQTKLGILYQAAQVAAETERERADEKAIADIGRLNRLPPMGLGSN